MTGVRVADGHNSQRHAAESPQIQEASQGESQNIHGPQSQKQQSYFKNNLTNIEEMKEDNASEIQQAQDPNAAVMGQLQEQQILMQDSSMPKAKRKDGGTGAGG